MKAEKTLPAVILVSFLLLTALSLAQEPKGTAKEIPENRTSTREECEPNLGEPCSNHSDCKACYDYKPFCIKCPSDTQVVIQTDKDPNHAELTNDTHFTTKSSDKGRCAYRAIGTRKCVGSWEGDEYKIVPNYGTTNSAIYTELTKDVLDKWKEVVLRNISESYFEKHINIIQIEPQVANRMGMTYVYPNTEDKILGVGIQYVFKYDWATAGAPREVIYIKQLSNGKWKWINDEEIRRIFDEHRQFLHNNNHFKATDYEIDSIISKEQARSKLKECHSDINLEEIHVRSGNNSIQLIASGNININTDKCEGNPQGSYTSISATVDLITGKSSCKSYKQPCTLYASGEGDGGTSERQNLFLYIGIGGIMAVLIIFAAFLVKEK